ncbi:hypothetical protein A359_01040 [secondary endosymbiont of Ctenarytaina eucalypti]|uniref:Uncharacterized protein n=1 Tax=secondary endosymbiont of Ctenarytaina eucalypti TaxID=1199245 RepID=J3YR71_9ENTR|nr:hypothetical protein A359_01040 [secondary endosymbiont of Ctenarytaina eucalypti]
MSALKNPQISPIPDLTLISVTSGTLSVRHALIGRLCSVNSKNNQTILSSFLLLYHRYTDSGEYLEIFRAGILLIPLLSEQDPLIRYCFYSIYYT